MTTPRIVEENKHSAAQEKEGGCVCGCGGGMAREATLASREETHSPQTPEGPCGCDRSCGCDGVSRN